MMQPFNHKKATQALNYLAQKETGQINKMKALKLVYFADRYHLRKYGRLITNDTYYAMEHGPVASGVKDIAESSSFLDERERTYAAQYIRPVSTLKFESVTEVDEEVFSESDIEALEFAWSIFGTYDHFQLRDITHEYPEWRNHEQALKSASRVDMDIEDFLEDPGAGVNKCYELDEEDRHDLREQLHETSEIEALWR